MMQNYYHNVLPLLLGLAATLNTVPPIHALTTSDDRHNIDTTTYELDMDAGSTYDTQFMALMESPCRPEYDGYFGSTSGDSLDVQYGFRLETPPFSTIMDLLDVVEDRVVDSILSHSFPAQCGFRRRELQRRLSSASGFRFMKFQEVEKCEPSDGPVNFCGIFVGHVSVFGKNVNAAAIETLSLIDEILNTDNPAILHPDIIQISSSDKYINVNGEAINTVQGGGGVDVASIGWAGLGIAALLMVALFYWFVIRNEKEGDTAYSNNSKRRRTKRSRKGKGYFGGQERSHKSDPEGKSLERSFEPEAVSFGSGGTLLLTDGRPVEIDFDQCSSSYTDQTYPHTYADATLSESATHHTMEARSRQSIV